MVHLMRLCLHFGVSHPGAQVVDLAQADSREEARNLAMALARIAPRRISARVTEFGLAHRRAEQEKQRHRPHRTFASPQVPLQLRDSRRGRGGRELFEFGLQGRVSRMHTLEQGEGGRGISSEVPGSQAQTGVDDLCGGGMSACLATACSSRSATPAAAKWTSDTAEVSSGGQSLTAVKVRRCTTELVHSWGRRYVCALCASPSSRNAPQCPPAEAPRSVAGAAAGPRQPACQGAPTPPPPPPPPATRALRRARRRAARHSSTQRRCRGRRPTPPP